MELHDWKLNLESEVLSKTSEYDNHLGSDELPPVNGHLGDRELTVKPTLDNLGRFLFYNIFSVINYKIKGSLFSLWKSTFDAG